MRRAALALILIPGGVLSQTEKEIAHVHGTGRLDVLVSEASLSLSLAVPAVDILGFEKPADSDEDRTLVARAISDLSKPLDLFLLPEEAACLTTAANVTMQTEGLGQGTEADQEYHAEFLADYQIECQNVEVVEAIRLAYFDHFPKAEKLMIRLDHTTGVRTHDATRDAPDLPF